jgi:hypothetical protein
MPDKRPSTSIQQTFIFYEAGFTQENLQDLSLGLQQGRKHILFIALLAAQRRLTPK